MNQASRVLAHVVLSVGVLAAGNGVAWAAGNGLRGEYFNNTGLVGPPAIIRTDPVIGFAWSTFGPAPGVSANYYSARWTGKVEAGAAGMYQFAITSDEGVRLWINNALVVDHWNAHSAAKNTVPSMALSAGQKLDVKIEYWEGSGSATAQLLWTPPGGTEVLIPQASLYSDPVARTYVPPVYLSSLAPAGTPLNGWGPYEKDRSNGESASGDGATQALNAVKFGKGLGVHAASELRYTLNSQYRFFNAFVGIDDEIAAGGSAIFQVWLDGVKAWESPVRRSTDAALPVTVNVTGKTELKLIVTDAGDGSSMDHADWADARLEPIIAPAAVVPPPAPTNITVTPGGGQLIIRWTASPGATGYEVYRGTVSHRQSSSAVAKLPGTSYYDTGLTPGTTYYFKVVATNPGGSSLVSAQASGVPNSTTVPAAPTLTSATPGDRQVTLAWTAPSNAAQFNVYRSTSSNSQTDSAVATNVIGGAYIDTGLTNNVTYYYKIAAVDANGAGALSNEVNAKPVPPPPPAAPTGLSATPGDRRVVLAWNSVSGAASYSVLRGTRTNTQSSTPVATGVTGVTYTDLNLINGTTYFYKVVAVAPSGTSARSNEASAMPSAPGLILSAAQKEAFRFLRQSTFGPTLPLADHVVQVGKAAFIDEQLVAPQSVYPDALITLPNMDMVSERMMQNAISGQDQLRMRVAWALSQIFVVSANKVNNTHAMVPYIRMLHSRAFGNVKDIMRDVSLSPAMGEFLDMVNNKKASNGAMPNENYAREWLQLFSIGLQELNDDGTPRQPVSSTYTQNDILELSRILTGWTYGNATNTQPTSLAQPYYAGPMLPVERFHDNGAKTFLGEAFLPGQTATQDFNQALDVVFNHHNVGPFLVRQLIQRLVTSNPSPTYIRDIVAVFNNNGQNVRGDLAAVVKAILLHPEAANGTPTSGKFSEPVLFLTNISRALGATIADHPFLTDYSQEMGQRVWFAPSVFNYFSPNYRSGNLFAPELQIWSTATAMTRVNFVASLVSNGFGSDVVLNLTPFNSVAPDPNALTDTVDSLILGGTMSSGMRQAILTALQSATSVNERVRTALYLTATSMQYQVEH